MRETAVKVIRLLLAMGLTGVASCSTTPAEPVDLDSALAEQGYAEKTSINRVPNKGSLSWSYLTDKAVVLKFNRSKHYLATFSISCPEVRHAQAIAFRNGLMSLSRHDNIIVRSGSGVRRCAIDELYKLEKAEE